MRTHLRKLKKFNDGLAAWGTRSFGTMAVFWVCFFYGLLPLIPSLRSHESVLLYWSNWVQLWALPLLMVGNIVLSREASLRAEKDHEAIMEILRDIRALSGTTNK